MILVATIAGAAGALCRYALTGIIQRSTRSQFPMGTLVVNLIGAFLLGVVAGVDELQSAASLTAAAFLGGFTTFSTWINESIFLGVVPLRTQAIVNLAATLIAGVALAAVGYSLTN